MRDAQRQKLYDSESRLRTTLRGGARGASTEALERTFGSDAEVAAYCREITDRHGLRPITVRGKRGRDQRYSTMFHDGTMALARWGYREMVVLHELAHWFTAGPLPSHGPTFAQWMVDLVTEQSPVLGAALIQRFGADGVLHGKAAAHTLALRELRNIINGVRGEVGVRLLYEDGPYAVRSSEYVGVRALRQMVEPRTTLGTADLLAVGSWAA